MKTNMKSFEEQLEQRRHGLLCGLLKETEQMMGLFGPSSDWQELAKELKQKVSNSAVKLELIKEQTTVSV